jgi:hypothetical protein
VEILAISQLIKRIVPFALAILSVLVILIKNGQIEIINLFWPFSHGISKNLCHIIPSRVIFTVILITHIISIQCYLKLRNDKSSVHYHYDW